MDFGCNNGGSKADGRKAFIASSERGKKPDQLFIQPRKKKKVPDKLFLNRPNAGKDQVPTSLPEEGKPDEASNAESPISLPSSNPEAIQSTEPKNCFPNIDDAKTGLISGSPVHQISNSKPRARLISLSELREPAAKPPFEVGTSDLKPKSKKFVFSHSDGFQCRRLSTSSSKSNFHRQFLHPRSFHFDPDLGR